MDGSTLGMLAGGIALGLGGTAIWVALRGLGEAFDLVTGQKEIEL